MKEGILALSQSGPDGIKSLLAALDGAKYVERKEITQSLGNHGTAAVETLVAALKDENVFVREAAAEALGMIGDVRATAPLLSVLHDADNDVRYKAAMSLDKFGIAAIKPLIAALKDDDRLVRKTAVERLGILGDVRAVEPLIEVVKDSNAQSERGWNSVRESAAKALGELGDRRAIEPLVAAFENSGQRERAEIGDALRKLGFSTLETLLAALKHLDKDVREAAARALGELSDERAVAPLGEMLKDGYYSVRGSAAVALKKIGGPEAERLLATPWAAIY